MQICAGTRDDVSFGRSSDSRDTRQNVPINAAERAHPMALIYLQLEGNFRAKGGRCHRNKTTCRKHNTWTQWLRNETIL